MTNVSPETKLDARYSSEGAEATSWEAAREQLERAELFWISTVRPDGRPHVTPLIAGWIDGALYFSTGPGERKEMNLVANPHCVMTTGCNSWSQGLDIVLEGDAVRVRDEATLRRLQALYDSKYNWHFTVRNGSFWQDDHEAYVFAVAPKTAFGFGKGNAIEHFSSDTDPAPKTPAAGPAQPFSQTRWRF
jgi:hypothetical protein